MSRKITGEGGLRGGQSGLQGTRLVQVCLQDHLQSHTITTFNDGDRSSNMMNKVRILQLLNHPYIISLEDVMDTANFLFMVLELADKIIEKTKLNKAKATLHFFPNCFGNQVSAFEDDLSKGPKA